MKYLSPSEINIPMLAILANHLGATSWTKALNEYRNMLRDKDRPSTREELDRINDLFAVARLRGKS